MGDANNITLIGMQTNIPVSPEIQSHFATAAILEADGYNSDKDVNLNNPIINKESLEVDEEELPEVSADMDAVEGQGTTTNVGTFVDIPSDVIQKMKVTELKDELSKRGQPTSGLKAVLLQRLADTITNHVPIMANGQGTTTTPSEDLRGFAPRARWKPLVAMEAAVDEPPNRLTTMHTPTVPADDMSFLPQKHDFAEEFDHLSFVGKEKIPKFHYNGCPVMKDGQPVWTE